MVLNLTSGGKLTSTGSAVTAMITPVVGEDVYVFVSLAVGQGEAPIPTLGGCGVVWEHLGTWWKKSGAPRNFTLYRGVGAGPGQITIGGIPAPKTHVTWSVIEGGDELIQLAANTEGGLETSHQVTLDIPPTSDVIAGFMVGQQGVVSAVAPFVELGQGHTSFFTTMSEHGTEQTASVTWVEPGHSIGIAVEVACSTGS